MSGREETEDLVSPQHLLKERGQPRSTHTTSGSQLEFPPEKWCQPPPNLGPSPPEHVPTSATYLLQTHMPPQDTDPNQQPSHSRP